MAHVYKLYVCRQLYGKLFIQAACTDLHQECLSVCPLLCQHPQWRYILLLGEGHQSPPWNQWCWQCWQHAPLSQLVKRVDMSRSTLETLLPDGGWVGSNWQGQLCCWWPSPPAHCSLGQWELNMTDEGDHQINEVASLESREDSLRWSALLKCVTLNPNGNGLCTMVIPIKDKVANYTW